MDINSKEDAIKAINRLKTLSLKFDPARIKKLIASGEREFGQPFILEEVQAITESLKKYINKLETPDK